MRTRRAAAVIVVMISVSVVGCGGSSSKKAAEATVSESTSVQTTAAPETTANQLAADKQLIMAMWRAKNDAWNAGRSAGIQSDIDSSYPPTRAANNMTFAGCDQYYDKGLWFNAVIDESTIEPQPGWKEPSTGSAPDGRVYVMTATFSSRFGSAQQPTSTQEVHAVVANDGKAYSFAICKP
jgi:hypothetical protein